MRIINYSFKPNGAEIFSWIISHGFCVQHRQPWSKPGATAQMPNTLQYVSYNFPFAISYILHVYMHEAIIQCVVLEHDRGTYINHHRVHTHTHTFYDTMRSHIRGASPKGFARTRQTLCVCVCFLTRKKFFF